MNKTKLFFALAFIMVAVAITVSCNKEKFVEAQTSILDIKSTNGPMILGTLVNGEAVPTVQTTLINNTINSISVSNGNLSGQFLSHEIIDEGIYGYSYLVTYSIIEIGGQANTFTTSIPVELENNDFIPGVTIGGVLSPRKSVTCKSKNCGPEGCQPRKGSCTDCNGGEDSSCEESITDNRGGGEGPWMTIISAILSWYLGQL